MPHFANAKKNNLKNKLKEQWHTVYIRISAFCLWGRGKIFLISGSNCPPYHQCPGTGIWRCLGVSMTTSWQLNVRNAVFTCNKAASFLREGAAGIVANTCLRWFSIKRRGEQRQAVGETVGQNNDNLLKCPSLRLWLSEIMSLFVWRQSRNTWFWLRIWVSSPSQ